MTTAMTSNGQQNFSSAFPFDFSFENQFQGEGLPIIYIVDSINNNSAAQQVMISASVKDNNTYTFTGFNFTSPAAPTVATPAATATLAPANANFTPDDTQYHLALIFRPGTLKNSVLEGFATTLQSALASGLATNSCVVNGPITRASDGAQAWYIAFANDLTVSNANTPFLSFTLDGIAAAAGVGSRSTQIELHFSQVLLNDTGSPLSFYRSQHIDIVNHQGKTYAPLYFGVMGNNTLLNASGYVNSLTLYFQTIDGIELEFNEDTCIEFSFPNGGASDSAPVVFGSQSLVAAYSLNSFNGSGTVNQTVSPNGLIQFQASLTTTPQSLSSATFAFSNIQLSNAAGNEGEQTNCHEQVFIGVTVCNLPGYWDTQFQIPITKATSALNATLRLGEADTTGQLNSQGSRIEFLSGGQDPALSNVATVCIEENNGLNLLGSLPTAGTVGVAGVPRQPSVQASPGQPVSIRNADLLVVDGRLGIGNVAPGQVGGDFSNPNDISGGVNANEKFRVNGDAYLHGHLGINGDVGITGSAGDHQLSIVGQGDSSSGLAIYPPLNGKPAPADGWRINVDAYANLNIYGPSGPAITLNADSFNFNTRQGEATSVSVNGAINVTGDISATGNSSTTGNISATGEISATGNINAGGDICAQGEISATSLQITNGNGVCNNNFEVNGELSVNGTATIAGGIKFSDGSTQNSANVLPVCSVIVQQGKHGHYPTYPGEDNAENQLNLNAVSPQAGTWSRTSIFYSDTPNNPQRYTYSLFIKVAD